METAAEDRRLELAGLAYGGIPAPVAIPKDAVALRRRRLTFGQSRMPAGNAGADGFDAEVFDGIEKGIVHNPYQSCLRWYYYTTLAFARQPWAP